MWETYVTLSYSELWLISWLLTIHTFLVEHVLNCFASIAITTWHPYEDPEKTFGEEASSPAP